MRLALAQLDFLIGDLEGNARRILQAGRRAAEHGAELLLTPELSLWGYPPRDLLLRQALLERQELQLQALVAGLPAGVSVLVGVAEPRPGLESPRLWNALALVRGGRDWRVVARKRLLPSYDVFDESRYFLPGDVPAVLELGASGRTWRLGLSICEDLWVEQELQGQRLAGVDPIGELAERRINLLLNLSASPYGRGKLALRRQLAQRAAQRAGCPLLYVNQVGGNDELVFDGASFVVDAAGVPLWQGPSCRQALAIWESSRPGDPCLELSLDPPVEAILAAGMPGPEPESAEPATANLTTLVPAGEPPEMEQLLRALVLGVADYARKCGFRGALLGLSGGIDSALVAVIAAAALGGERVTALRLPSPWSSRGSLDDALELAERLGLDLRTLPIEPLMEGFAQALTPALGQAPDGVTAENLQSRIRGTLLMALANQQGRLLLSTGNKSELAVGYCTLYGDMNGGLAVIGDLYKTTVFALCDWIACPEARGCRRDLGLPASGPLIGEAIRRKPPSAELCPDQKDSDSLPDYAVLDPLLRQSIEAMATPEQLIAAGADPVLAQRVHSLLRRAEFKRRQAPPVLKVSSRSFGGGWRMPIAAAG
ncbi:MAG: NAD+ synthase [Cyanobium sp.]